jgi:CxxC motif-containing protein
MSDLLKILTVKTKEVINGEIETFVANQVYTVKIQGQLHSIKSLVSDVLSKGTKVIIADTVDGRFIIGSGSMQTRNQIEVFIEG